MKKVKTNGLNGISHGYNLWTRQLRKWRNIYFFRVAKITLMIPSVSHFEFVNFCRAHAWPFYFKWKVMLRLRGRRPSIWNSWNYNNRRVLIEPSRKPPLLPIPRFRNGWAILPFWRATMVYTQAPTWPTISGPLSTRANAVWCAERE